MNIVERHKNKIKERYMRVRTADLQVMALVLYPLSYAAVLTKRSVRVYTAAMLRTEGLRAPVAAHRIINASEKG